MDDTGVTDAVTGAGSAIYNKSAEGLGYVGSKIEENETLASMKTTTYNKVSESYSSLTSYFGWGSKEESAAAAAATEEKKEEEVPGAAAAQSSTPAQQPQDDGFGEPNTIVPKKED